MPNQAAPTKYESEDILFLILKLIDYPTGRKSVFSANDLKFLHYKKMNLLDVLKTIDNLYMDTEELSFDQFYFDPRAVGSTIREAQNVLSNCLVFANENPNAPESFAINQILANDFKFEHVEEIIHPTYTKAILLAIGINFSIIASQSFRSQMGKRIATYLDDFIQDRLEKKNYHYFEAHQKIGLAKLKEIVEKLGTKLLLTESDFGRNFRFLEYMLFLQNSNYISIENFSLDEKRELAVTAKAKKKLLDQIKSTDKKSEKKIIKTLPIPAGMAWEDVLMQFADKNELEIFVRGHFIKQINYVNLGCYDLKSKDKSPDVQWQMLRSLSITRGRLDMRTNPDIAKITNREKQKKKKLSANLKKLFGFKDDPFGFSSKVGIFQTRFKLEPIPELRGDGELHGLVDENLIR